MCDVEGRANVVERLPDPNERRVDTRQLLNGLRNPFLDVSVEQGS
jgi:hypothetical protein